MGREEGEGPSQLSRNRAGLGGSRARRLGSVSGAGLPARSSGANSQALGPHPQNGPAPGHLPGSRNEGPRPGLVLRTWSVVRVRSDCFCNFPSRGNLEGILGTEAVTPRKPVISTHVPWDSELYFQVGLLEKEVGDAVLGQTKVKASDEGAKRKGSPRMSTWERGSSWVLGAPRPFPSQTFILRPESPS